MPLTDTLVRGAVFDGETGMKTGADLEDLVTKATLTNNSQLVDQETLDVSLDAVLSVYRARIKPGGVGTDQLADGAVTLDKLAKFLRMQHAEQGDALTITSDYQDIPDLSVTAAETGLALCILTTTLAGSVVVTGQLAINDVGTGLERITSVVSGWTLHFTTFWIAAVTAADVIKPQLKNDGQTSGTATVSSLAVLILKGET